MMDFRSAEYRYLRDNDFRALVDYMENFIHRLQFTSSEMRDAAMLACLRFEMKRPFPSHFPAEGPGAQRPEQENKKEI